MALFASDFSISGVNTAGTVLLNLKAPSGNPLTVISFQVFYSVLSTTAYDVGLVRMNAVGTGTITSAAGAGYMTGSTGAAVLETAWATTRPTVTGARFWRAVMPLTLGAGYVAPLYTVGEGIFVPASGGLCFYGIGASGATTGTLTGSILWDE
jgi:hypothetical protein